MRGEPAEHLLGITTDDGRHGGRGSGASLRHGTATLAYQNHRLFCRQHTDTCCRSDFADRVARNHTNERVSVGRMRKKFQGRKEAGRDQEWLGDRGVSDGFGVGFGAVMPQIEA